jgi:hypothetical protein
MKKSVEPPVALMVTHKETWFRPPTIELIFGFVPGGGGGFSLGHFHSWGYANLALERLERALERIQAQKK